MKRITLFLLRFLLTVSLVLIAFDSSSGIFSTTQGQFPTNPTSNIPVPIPTPPSLPPSTPASLGSFTNPLDSIALLAIYVSTDSANWTTKWDINSPVTDWAGVRLFTDTNNVRRVYSINLPANNLSGDLIGLDQLQELTYVRLDSNDITSLPDLSPLQKLERLYVGANSLSELPGLGSLGLLRELYIYQNNFRDSIPGLSNLSSLRTLQLSGNRISSLNGVQFLTNLISIFAPNNQIERLPNLQNLTQLTQLMVANNRLSRLPEGLDQTDSLTFIVLSSNRLSSLEGLPYRTRYRQFQCERNQLTFDQIEPFLPMFNSGLVASYEPQDSVGPRQYLPIFQGGSNLVLTQPDKGTNSSYQWYQNGASLNGDTLPQLVIVPTDSSVAGTYYVEIRNSDFPDSFILHSHLRTISYYDSASPPPNRGTKTKVPTLLITYNRQNYNQVQYDSLKTVTEESFAEAGLTLASECHCGAYQLYNVPDTIEDLSDDGTLWQIVDPRTQPEYAESQLIPKEDDREFGFALWNYPTNLGSPPTVGNTQWRSSLDTRQLVRDITIAVIDFGVDSTHPAINPRLWRDPDTGDICYLGDPQGRNFWDGTNNPFKDVGPYAIGHGTHIAGLISTFLRPEDPISIMSIQIGDTSRQTRVFELICAMKYAIDEGADIINLSVGYYGENAKELDSLIRIANDRNIMIIASAGNEGLNNDLVSHHPSNSNSQYPNVIAVGALDPSKIAENPQNDTLLLPSFTNVGRNSVDYFAPGVGIYAPLPNYEYGAKNGTSIAAAFVSVTIAKIMGQADEHTVESINSQLSSDDYSVSDGRLTNFSRTGKRVKIELINCGESPYARPDSFLVSEGQTMILDVIQNDCRGEGTLLQLPANHPPFVSIDDTQQDNFRLLFTVPAGANVGQVFEFEYSLAGTVGSDSTTVKVTIIPELYVEGTTITPGNNVVPNVTYVLEDIGTGTTQAVMSNVSYQFNVPASSTFSIRPEKIDPSKKGVDGGDVVSLIQYLNNSLLLDTFELIAADVNFDRTINNEDYALIGEYIIDDRQQFSRTKQHQSTPKSWVFVPTFFRASAQAFPPIVYPEQLIVSNITSPKTDQDFLGIKLGDVQNNWTANTFGTTRTRSLSFDLPDQNTFLGDEIEIPIYGKNVTDISTFQFTIEWDSTHLEWISTEADSISLTVGTTQKENGALAVLWYHSEGLTKSFSPDEPMFTLKYRVIDNELKEIPITFSDEITPIMAFDGLPEELNVAHNGGTLRIRRGICGWILKIIKNLSGSQQS